MSDKPEKYIEKLKQLLDYRKTPTYTEAGEDEFLDELDVLWYSMDEDEMQEAEKMNLELKKISQPVETSNTEI